jgi:hypothetical protein
MYRPKYGDVSAIADKTNECCHLCGEPAPLHTYGRCNIYGGRAASIDHLVPQYFGGDHAPENLMWAHQGCNSYRGVRDFEEVRMELRGDTYMMEDEPVDNGAQVLLGAAGGMALAPHWATCCKARRRQTKIGNVPTDVPSSEPCSVGY